MNLGFKFWSNQFTSKFSHFQQNCPTVFLDEYRIFLSSVSKEEQAKNRPWVFSHRLGFNEAGGEASGLSLAEPLDKTKISKKYFLEANHIIVCTCGFLRNAFIETTERIQQVSDN